MHKEKLMAIDAEIARLEGEIAGLVPDAFKKAYTMTRPTHETVFRDEVVMKALNDTERNSLKHGKWDDSQFNKLDDGGSDARPTYLFKYQKNSTTDVYIAFYETSATCAFSVMTLQAKFKAMSQQKTLFQIASPDVAKRLLKAHLDSM